MSFLIGFIEATFCLIGALSVIAMLMLSASYCDDLNANRRCMGIRYGNWHLMVADLTRQEQPNE